MPESDLTLSIDDLKGEIGAYMGYGRGLPFSEPAWDTRQTNNIVAILKSGLSQVYTPPPLSPGEPSHNWSFLRPIDEFVLASGTSEAILPGSFGGFESPIFVHNPAVAARRWPLKVSHIGIVDSLHASQPTTTGAPRYCCEKVLKGTTKNESTRSVLYVWPTADADYTLTAQWKHLPGTLTGSFPYPPGGAEHSELFKASVLAAAELQLDDQPGPRHAFFLERLAASVYADRKRKGTYLGYNGDRSDMRYAPRVPGSYNRYFDNPAVTYNGQPL